MSVNAAYMLCSRTADGASNASAAAAAVARFASTTRSPAAIGRDAGELASYIGTNEKRAGEVELLLDRDPRRVVVEAVEGEKLTPGAPSSRGHRRLSEPRHLMVP